jgi:tetratricopeptide (TPR) repeat protein
MSKSLQLFQQAYALHQQGRLDEAEPLYLKALSAAPKHADLLRMLGMLYLQRGNWKKGAQMTESSLRVNPAQPEAQNNLGYALQNLNRFDEALACYDRAISLNRVYAGAWYNRGNVLLSMGRYDEAVSGYRQALKIRPAHADSWVNQGKACKLMACYEDACYCYQQAIALSPDNAIAHNNLGNALNELNRCDEALTHFNKAIALAPDYADAYYNAGLVLQGMKRHEEAAACYRKVIVLQADHAEAHLNLGIVCHELKKIDDALVCFDQAIFLKPEDGNAYTRKGGGLIELGRMDEAEAILNQALLLSPDDIAPLISLLSLKRCHPGDPMLRRLEVHYAERESLSPEKRIDLNFAMGKAMEDVGGYDKSFEAYEEGNRLYCLEHPYDESEDICYAKSAAGFFSGELFDRFAALAAALPPVCDDRTPIFIVGMPRSGTTLIEQILASHPDLYGAGELAVLGELSGKVEIPAPDSPDLASSLLALRKLGQEYLDRVWELAPDARYITDKMPHNFLHLGLIPLMLPNAKIIHSMRDPMDCCFSSYALRFKEGHEYCYDMEMLGRHYQRYRELMVHWHNVLPPGRILDVSYEDNVADPEREARRLLAYLGLPWDAACLKFYENKRTVSTASVTQVRKPIYSGSVARWKRFEKHLGPLLEIVGSAALPEK